MGAVRLIPHVHVSEREAVHRWPDGTFDDAAWEDCLWASAIEWLRAIGRNVPATHAEAEALRAASGQGPLGGSGFRHLILGAKNRYDLTVPPPGMKSAFLAAFRPGVAAVIAGSLGGLPAGHKLRRWEPGFTGGHAVYVERTTDAILWCDPLAPVGSSPDRVALDDVERFLWSGVACAVWGSVAYTSQSEGEMYPIVTRSPFPIPVRWTVKAGTVLRGYDPAQPGKAVKELRFDRDSSARASARVGVSWRGVDADKAPIPRGAPFLEVLDGAFAGLLIVEAQVQLDPVPDPCAPARAKALDDAIAAISKLKGA
jgi:hypothetical protein